MRAEGGRAIAAHRAEKLVAPLVIGDGEHLARGREPLDAPHAMAARAVVVPVGGIGAAEAVQGVLRARQAQVAGMDLDHEDGDVDVVEEVQVDVRDVEHHRVRLVAGERHAHPGEVAAAEDADRRFARRRAALLALAVEEALHVRQEGHELAVVALLELRRITGELVGELAPGTLRAAALQHLPVLLDLLALADRHQLQRPEQDLAELAHDRRPRRPQSAGAEAPRPVPGPWASVC